jgi:hypothetical protein
MSGAIPPLPNTLSWRGAQLKKAQGQLVLSTEALYNILIEFGIPMILVWLIKTLKLIMKST